MSSIRKIRFDSVDREVCRYIYKHNEINLYFFHDKYLLSPGQLSRSIRKLLKLKLIHINEDKVFLTVLGREIILKYKNSILRKRHEEYWEKIPNEMRARKMKINKKYLPNADKTDL